MDVQAIAEAAAEFVKPGMAIAIGAGEIPEVMARCLAGASKLTMVTNSVPVAEVLRRNGRADVTVVVMGGVCNSSNSVVGALAQRSLQSLHVDLAFVEAAGIDAAEGFTAVDLAEAAMNRAMLDTARKSVVLARSRAWGRIALSSMAALDQADVVVTDDGIRCDLRSLMADAVRELVCAPTRWPPTEAARHNRKVAG
jgi:DeoR/GlpR family transcriptional regulator of sugar metabolism